MQETLKAEYSKEEQKGNESQDKNANRLLVPWALVGGILLGGAIGRSLPERFEKTANMNVRFDTRTKQNCWVGAAQWEENTGRLFTGPPKETVVPNIPFCKDL